MSYSRNASFKLQKKLMKEFMKRREDEKKPEYYKRIRGVVTFDKRVKIDKYLKSPQAKIDQQLPVPIKISKEKLKKRVMDYHGMSLHNYRLFIKQSCKKCGLKTGQKHIHHIIPKSKGGTNDLSNLQVLCRECHEQTHGWRIPKINLTNGTN